MNSYGLYTERLTRRENDILTLLGQDLTDREIAKQLVLSLNSVKWYVRQVIGKLGVTNRKEAVTRAREIGLLAGSAPVKKTTYNLPRQLSSFIGREKEIDQVVKMIWEYPLVTLTGPGGVGKTRLAQVVTAEIADDFMDGVCYVELASLANPLLLVQTVAGAMGIREEPGRSLLELLLARYYDHQVLLVLDNCEHLIQASAGLVHTLLTHLPRLKVIVSSREPLGINGEVIFRVPSLNCPQDLQPQAVESALDFEAVRLFVERARAVQTDFQLTPANAPWVAQICQWMDGIPLAIELAAARTRMLSVEQIAARLDQTFHLLTGGSRSDLPRHQTLEALIDWSYYLLSPKERKLLLRLSVFAGGWSLEAAEQVCGDRKNLNDPGQPPASGTIQGEQIFDLLGELIDKSLIQFDPSCDDAPRYSMLVTVRQYARERLQETGETEALGDRHLDYYLSLALQAEPHLRSRLAKSWMDRLEREAGNLRLALDHAHSGEVEKGLRLAESLFWFWISRGRITEIAERLDRLLYVQPGQRASVNLEPAQKISRGKGLLQLGQMINWNYYQLPDRLVQQKNAVNEESKAIFGDLGDQFPRETAIFYFYQAQTVEDTLACRKLFQAINDPFWTAECDLKLATLFLPDDARAVFYGEENLALRKEIGDLEGEAEGLFRLGYIEVCRNNIVRSVELTRQSQICYEEIGNQYMAATVHAGFAFFYNTHGNPVEALRQCELLLAAATTLNDRFLLFSYFIRRAWVASANQEYEQTEHYCEEALKVGRTFPLEEKMLLYDLLCRVCLARGDAIQARKYLMKYFKPETFWTDWSASYRAIQNLASIAIQEGKLQQAAIWFGAMNGVFKQHVWVSDCFAPIERSEYEQALLITRARLGEQAFSSAWEAGFILTAEQVLQLAMEEGI